MSSNDHERTGRAAGDSFYPYEITSRGTNSQGNRYDTREQPCGPGYHYSNQDGSYAYQNGDGSKYYDNGRGYATYTAPDGVIYDKSYSTNPSHDTSGSAGSDNSDDETLRRLQDEDKARGDSSDGEDELEQDQQPVYEDNDEQEESNDSGDEAFYSDAEDFEDGHDDDGGYYDDVDNYYEGGGYGEDDDDY